MTGESEQKQHYFAARSGTGGQERPALQRGLCGASGQARQEGTLIPRFLTSSDLEALMTGRLLDRAEAAERLHVSERTVRRLTAAGHLTEVRVSLRAIRIDEDSVERHIAGRRVTRTTEGTGAA
jgi:excisionase family DNA binding protein